MYIYIHIYIWMVDGVIPSAAWQLWVVFASSPVTSPLLMRQPACQGRFFTCFCFPGSPPPSNAEGAASSTSQTDATLAPR